MELDTTAGSLNNRRVLKIAIPVVLSNATVPILGAVDTAVVGQLGAAAPIGAVGVGAVILSSVYWIFGFLRMGTTGLAAQAAGAGNAEELVALLSRALLIATGAGAILIAGQAAIFAAAFAIAPATAEVEGLARTYMAIRIWSAPAAIALYGITGWLIAQERTTAVLLLQLVMNGANILLSFWLGLGLDWGVAGVATATIIAEWAGVALGLWFCRAAFGGSAWRDPRRVLDGTRLRRMAVVNGDILIRSVLLQGIVVSFMFLGAGFGTLALAANQVLFQFLHITAHALDGFAFAVEALVGRFFGARDRAGLHRAVRLSSVWALGTALLLAAGFALFGPSLIDLMATAPEVRAAARSYLPWLLIAPLLGVAPFILDGIFIGATRTRDMRNMMLLSVGIYALAVLAFTPVLGNHGLWAALMVSFVARAVSLAARYPALERAALR